MHRENKEERDRGNLSEKLSRRLTGTLCAVAAFKYNIVRDHFIFIYCKSIHVLQYATSEIY